LGVEGKCEGQSDDESLRDAGNPHELAMSISLMGGWCAFRPRQADLVLHRVKAPRIALSEAQAEVHDRQRLRLLLGCLG
jgi:hypothetical protein